MALFEVKLTCPSVLLENIKGQFIETELNI
jgi:hypothetical protein